MSARFRETVGQPRASTTSVRASNLAPRRALVYAPCMHRLVLCLGLWSAASPAVEVYRWVDPDGNTQYSDQPRPNAQVIRIPKAPAAPAPAPPPAAAPAGDPAPSDPAAPKFAGYDKIAVVNPPNDGTVWDNSGNVSIEIAVAPALQGTLGHKLLVLLNGQPLGEPIAATSFTVTNLDRNTYTLQARIVDADGKVLGESPPSVFHMKRISAALPPATPTSAAPPAAPTSATPPAAPTSAMPPAAPTSATPPAAPPATP